MWIAAVVQSALVLGLCAGCTSPQENRRTRFPGGGFPADELAFEVEFIPSGSIDENDIRFARALAHYGQALIHESQGGSFSTQTSNELHAALELDPGSQRLYGKLAADALMRRPPDTNTAVRILEDACRAIPDSVPAHVALAAAYQLCGRPDLAAEKFRDAVAISPTNTMLYMELAKYLYLTKKDKEAVHALSEGIRAGNNYRWIMAFASLAASQFVAKGQPERAIPLLELVAANLQSSRSETYVVMGQLYEQMKDPERAAKYFWKAADCEPPLPEPFFRLVRLHLNEGSLPEGLAAMEEADRRIPDNMHILKGLGNIYSISKQHANAAAAYERLFKVAERSGSVPTVEDRVNYAAAYDQSGRFDKAEPILQECIELHPDAHEALNYLAYSWAEKDMNLEKGLEYVTRALQHEPDNGAYIDTLGWIYFKMKDYPKALEHLKRASELVKADSTIADHIGSAQMALGDKESALLNWKLSLSIDPENDDVAKRLEANGVDVRSLRKEARRAAKAKKTNAKKSEPVKGE